MMMMAKRFLLGALAAEAQPVATFRWQRQPYCNVVTVAITRNGDVAVGHQFQGELPRPLG